MTITVALKTVLASKKLQQKIINSLKQGDIIIYPTDTVYGIGCDATSKKAVACLSKAKQRKPGQPFSLIAPSKEWIQQNTILPRLAKRFLNKLPGRYTFILKAKPSIKRLATKGTIGVRIPKHLFTNSIRKHNILLTTTSVNLSGQPPSQNIQEMPTRLKKAASYIIDAGKLAGKPSTIIDLRGTPKRIR